MGGLQGLELNLALLHKAQGVHVVLVAVHHGGVQIQLGVVQLRQVDVGGLGEHGHQDEGAALARVLDGLVHGDVVAGAVIDHVRLVRAEAGDQGLAEVAPGGVDGIVRAHRSGQLQAHVGDVGDHDGGGPAGLQRLGQQDADGARAQDDGLAALHVREALGGVHGHGQRLDHRAVVVAHALGQGRDLGGVHREVIAGGAGGLEAHDLQLLAEIVLAVEAGIAAPAEDLRLDGHGLADGEVMHVLAQLHNLAGDLVALGHRVGGVGVLAVVDVDVRPAHADAADAHQHLVGAWGRDGDLTEGDFARGGHDLLTHGGGDGHQALLLIGYRLTENRSQFLLIYFVMMYPVLPPTETLHQDLPYFSRVTFVPGRYSASTL